MAQLPFAEPILPPGGDSTGASGGRNIIGSWSATLGPILGQILGMGNTAGTMPATGDTGGVAMPGTSIGGSNISFPGGGGSYPAFSDPYGGDWQAWAAQNMPQALRLGGSYATAAQAAYKGWLNQQQTNYDWQKLQAYRNGINSQRISSTQNNGSAGQKPISPSQLWGAQSQLGTGAGNKVIMNPYYGAYGGGPF